MMRICKKITSLIVLGAFLLFFERSQNAQEPGQPAGTMLLNDGVSAYPTAWLDIPGLTTTINSTGYPVLVYASISGVQVDGYKSDRFDGKHEVSKLSFRLLIDGVPRDLSPHEFNYGAYELRGVTLSTLIQLQAGTHKCSVQWYSAEMKREHRAVASGSNGSRYIWALEVGNAADHRTLRKDLHEAVVLFGEETRKIDRMRSEIEAALRKELEPKLRAEIKESLLKDKEFIAQLKKAVASNPHDPSGTPKGASER
jgi:hypothetical protein